jgi:hypothetical protein
MADSAKIAGNIWTRSNVCSPIFLPLNLSLENANADAEPIVTEITEVAAEIISVFCIQVINGIVGSLNSAR